MQTINKPIYLLSKTMEKQLEESAKIAGITKIEAIRRALCLFFEAVKSDDVLLTSNNRQQKVLIK